jgi:hypothetical protein
MVDSRWGPSQVGVDFAAHVDYYQEESMAIAAHVEFAAHVDCYEEESVALEKGRCISWTIGHNRA